MKIRYKKKKLIDLSKISGGTGLDVTFKGNTKIGGELTAINNAQEITSGSVNTTINEYHKKEKVKILGIEF